MTRDPVHTIANRLQKETTQVQRRSRLAAIAGWVQLLLFAVLLWLTVDPEAHQWLHHDHERANHHCAVQLVSQGNVVASVPPAIAVIVTPGFFLLPLPARKCVARVAPGFLLPFSCGPPLA